MNIVIYARYSPGSKQNEASIEGQLKVCYEYAKTNNLNIIAEYIDRALTGTNDKRSDFLRMIEDSRKKQFKAVLVYQFDRFARNLYENLDYERKLLKNGAKIISAMENMGDNAAGRFMRNVLLANNQYYSEELSQKIKRGIELKAEKCLYTGGGVALGYQIRKEEIGRNFKGETLYNNHIEIEPTAAAIVNKIFEMYASGSTMARINEYLNAQQIQTIRGGAFNKNSLCKLLQNKRYIGIFTFKGKEIPSGIPRIISDELFYKVQIKMSENKKAPARARAKEDYILTTKLFCGHCKDMMTGTSGTSQTGKVYHYYACNKATKKLCDKKKVAKQWIEDLVITKCWELLTDENIDIISAAVVDACKKDVDETNLKRLHKLLKENQKAVDNLFKALEAGQVIEQITQRIQDKNIERGDLQKQIAAEELTIDTLTARDIKFFLIQLQKGNINDIANRKAIVTVFVNAIYLYDDRITFILNAGDKPVVIDEPLLSDIEQSAECSCIDHLSPP